MSESVHVYLDREALVGSLLNLLLPEDGAAQRAVEATATEIKGEPANPATLQRVYREVDEPLTAGRSDGDEDSVMDQLMELFGDDWTVESEGPGKLTAEQADAQADRAVAHRIIAEPAKAYPLPPEQWSDLAVAE